MWFTFSHLFRFCVFRSPPRPISENLKMAQSNFFFSVHCSVFFSWRSCRKDGGLSEDGAAIGSFVKLLWELFHRHIKHGATAVSRCICINLHVSVRKPLFGCPTGADDSCRKPMLSKSMGEKENDSAFFYWDNPSNVMKAFTRMRILSLLYCVWQWITFR